MKHYVIQFKIKPWDTKWVTGATRYDTLEEARAAFGKLSDKRDHRIAEAYTVVRYKPVKL